MERSRQHLFNHLECPRRHCMLYLVAAIVAILNTAATVSTLLAVD